MSVSVMKRLTVLSPADRADELIQRLMRLRCVDIRTAPPDEEDGLGRYDSDTARVAAERRVATVTEAIGTLSGYGAPKPKKASKKDKPPTGDARFPVTKDRAGAYRWAETVAGLNADVADCRAERSREEATISMLAPWSAHDLPLEVEETDTCRIFRGVLPSGVSLSAVADALSETHAAVEEVSHDEHGLYVVVILCREDEEAVSRALGAAGFVFANFNGLTGTAVEATRAARDRIEALDDRLRAYTDRLRELSAARREMEILYDLEMTDLLAAREQQKMAAAGSCVLLTGWIPAGREERVVATLERMACAYETSDPEPGDEPPILLKNNGYASNFEWVVGMYAYPKYGTYDPTFVMSIFYFLIFGLMFADVGYGALLILGGFLLPKLLHFKSGMTRTFHMFGYCGISCTILGFVFGGWFGDLPYAIMTGMMGYESAEAAQAAVPLFNGLGPLLGGLPFSLNPLENPMAFLIISLAMGGVHLIGGMAVKFYLLCKDGKVADALMDIGSYWVLFAGIGVIFVQRTVGLVLLGVGALTIVATFGRKQKNPVMRVLMGFKGLYNLISYASDLLSYSRILALGLAAGVIAQVVNLIATMGGPTISGILLMVPVMIFGHVLNIGINLLGAFVHTSRLQYLEFFGKFYEDGGEPFDPALPSEKYTTAEPLPDGDRLPNEVLPPNGG